MQFAQLYEEEEESDDKDKWAYKPYRWLHITYVCNRWREVALSTPRLWSHIALGVNTKPLLVDLVIQRSKDVPISLKVNILGQQSQIVTKAIDILRHHTSRLWSVELRCYRFKFNSELLTLETPLPLLRCLSLVSVDITDADINPVQLLLSRPTPLLEYLELMNKVFIWEPKAFQPGLKCIRLGSTFGGSSAQGARFPTTIQFIQALRSMPLLEELSLENVFPLPDASFGDEVVFLPRLKSLRLMGSAQECTSVLRHVSFPYGIAMDFLIRSMRDTQDLIEYFEPALRKRVNPPEERLDPPGYSAAIVEEGSNTLPRSSLHDSERVLSVAPICSFSVKALQSRVVALRGWTDLCDFDVMDDNRFLNALRFKFIVEGTVFSPANLLETLARELPLSKVKVLELDGINHITRPIWLNTLAQMTELDILYLKGRSGEFLPEALLAQQLRHPVVPGQRHTEAIFPKLKTIHLDGVNFDVIIPENPDHERRRFFRRFVDCLATRKQRDSDTGIRKLIIKKAVNLDESQKDLFVPWVEELIWDGIVHMEVPDQIEKGDAQPRRDIGTAR